MKNTVVLMQTVIAVVMLTYANAAAAAAAFCPDDVGYEETIEDNVSPSVGCQIGTTNNDRLGGDPAGYQVNLDMMFGFDDWIFAEKAFEGGQAIDIGLSIVGDTISGQWSIDDIWNSMGVSSLMLVFKSGDGEPDGYVGYLIAPGLTSGDYLTPFINAASGNPKDISHITAYFRTGSVSMSEPGTLALLVLGLFAIGRLARNNGHGAGVPAVSRVWRQIRSNSR